MLLSYLLVVRHEIALINIPASARCESWFISVQFLTPVGALHSDLPPTGCNARRETSDNPVYNSTMLDYMVCVECEKQYYKLRTQLVSQRAEILGKLKKLGFGGSAIPFLLIWLACVASSSAVG